MRVRQVVRLCPHKAAIVGSIPTPAIIRDFSRNFCKNHVKIVWATCMGCADEVPETSRYWHGETSGIR